MNKSYLELTYRNVLAPSAVSRSLEQGRSCSIAPLTRTLCLLVTSALLALLVFGAGCGTSNNESPADGGPLGDGRPLPDSADAKSPACVPKTCAELGYNCGPAGNGCGGSLSCGTCTAPETCGGGGTASVCGSPAGKGDASMGDTGSSGATFDYYISTTGSDSNPGTVASPWAITSLISNSPNNAKMVSKRVGLIAGTYNVAGTSGVAGATLIGNGSYPTNGSYCALSIPPGSASASTYIGSSDASGNYSARAATIHVVSGQTSASSNFWNNAIIGVDGPGTNNPTGNGGYVTLDGVVIDANGMDCPGPNGNEGAHIFMTQGPNGLYTTAGNQPGVVVQNCELYGINATDSGGNDAAVFLSGDDGAIIQNNYIHDINKSTQIDHAHGIEAYGSQNCQWNYNTFTNCTGGGAESKVGCFNNVSAYSYFYNDAPATNGNSAALQGWDGGEAPDGAASTFLLHHDIFDTCGRVTFGEEYNAIHKQGLSWYNNTVYDTRSSPGGTVVLQASGAWIQHYNNLYVLSTATNGGGWQQFTSGDCTILDYDCTYALSGSYTAMWQMRSANYNSLSAFQSASGAESHGIAGTDPKFIVGTTSIVSGAGPAQFKLASGSPAVGAGRVGGVATGAAVNMGAWDGSVTQIGASWVSYP
jgi:hypothetical protein